MSWELNRVGDICKVKSGKRLPKGMSVQDEPTTRKYLRVTDLKSHVVDESDIKYISEDIFKLISRYTISCDDIYISIAGTIGKVGIIPASIDGISLTENCCKLTELNKSKIIQHFLLHYLRSYEGQSKMKAKTGGASQPKLAITRLKDILIPTPPIQTQKRIADILSAYDDLIENNLKRIKLLEQAAQNIYKEWFVHLRFPGHENTPINEETGLPVGWENSELDSVATVQSSKRVFLADYVDNGVPFYRGKEISQKVKHEAVSEPYFISHEKFREFDNGFGSPKENDILITAVGTIGNCYLVRNSDLPFYFKDGNLLWIHSYNETVSGFYLIQYFQSPIFKGVLNSITIGSSQKALTIKAVKKLNITVPNNEILEKFDSIIKTNMKQIEVLANTMTQLKAARDILLPRLMNRTIEVE